ncbi:FAD-dependent oxidoreductase [Gammaproteobacteria bacterium]|nr:FAD-dependent oxidoreductase [Gammaproteobacteria bacterium]
MDIGIIGGGINGLFISWQLSSLGHNVKLYEADKVLQKTSSSSSKLLHGGIRYLEHGHLGLVRESLLDRSWWLSNAPQHTSPIEICMPVYNNSPRSIIQLYSGALLYRTLAGSHSLGPSKWKGKKKTLELRNEIKDKDLVGSVSFYDAQMDEMNLGNWVREKSIAAGTEIFEHEKVEYFSTNGEIESLKFGRKKFQFIVNATGPWAAHMNEKNKIDTKFYLRLIRGSHLILDHKISNSYLFQEPKDGRVIFIMPYLGKTLVGTTEVSQSLSEKTICSDEERQYLLNIYNSNFKRQICHSNISYEYSGLRPIVASHLRSKESYFSIASREAELEVNDKLITVYGGKWTSAPSLSRKVVRKIIG